MTEKPQVNHIQTGDNGQQENLKLMSTFACEYCGSGTETYSKLFSNGTCRNCGGPVKDFYATITETGAEKLTKSVLIIAAGDSQEKVEEMVAELNSIGVEALTAQEIVEGVQKPQATSSLTLVAQSTAYTLIVPSPGLEQDLVARATMNAILLESMEKEIKIVPVYFGKESFQHLSGFFQTRTGIDWNNLNLGHHSLPREKALRDFKAKLAQN